MKKVKYFQLTLISLIIFSCGYPCLAREGNNSSGRILSFYLGGGLGYIFNNGDFNQIIKSNRKYYSDLEDYYGYPNRHSYDVKELDFMPDFKVELLFNFHENIGIGLGTGYIYGQAKGNVLSYSQDSGYETNYSWIYKSQSDYNPNNKFHIIPLETRLYLMLPLTPMGKIYAFAGGGYYIGKWTLDYLYEYFYEYSEDWYGIYDGNDYKYTHDRHYDYSRTAKCNAVGFQAGGGFELNLSKNIALVFEGLLNLVNFNNWSGEYKRSGSWEKTYWKKSLGTYAILEEAIDEKEKGYFWYYEYYDETLWEYYKNWKMSQTKPDHDYINVRKMEIKFNKFLLRLGIRIYIF